MTKKDKDTPNAHGYVYKLHHKSQDLGNDFYVGSTVNKYERWRSHKRACNYQSQGKYNYKVYQFIRDHGNIEAWEMEIIKTYDNITIRQLERHEQEYRDELKPNLNINKSGSDISYLYPIDPKLYNIEHLKQWSQDNKEHLLEYRKQYYLENHNEMLEKNKQYRQEHKHEISEQQKIYREEHREDLSEKKKIYREKNKHILYEKQNQKFTCVCGSQYTRVNKLRHLKTKKHLQFLESQSAI